MLMSNLVLDMGNSPKMYLVNSIASGVDSILSKRAENQSNEASLIDTIFISKTGICAYVSKSCVLLNKPVLTSEKIFRKMIPVWPFLHQNTSHLSTW